MITTIDGYQKNNGDIAYIINFDPFLTSAYDLFKIIVSPFDNQQNGINYYHSKELCAEQCRLMNNDNNK